MKKEIPQTSKGNNLSGGTFQLYDTGKSTRKVQQGDFTLSILSASSKQQVVNDRQALVYNKMITLQRMPV